MTVGHGAPCRLPWPRAWRPAVALAGAREHGQAPGAAWAGAVVRGAQRPCAPRPGTVAQRLPTRGWCLAQRQRWGAQALGASATAGLIRQGEAPACPDDLSCADGAPGRPAARSEVCRPALLPDDMERRLEG